MKKRVVQLDEKSEVDLTPMLDVVFILLIFFIVTASFISEKSLKVQLPESTPKTDSKSTSVLISVDAENQIYFDGRRIDRRALSSLVAQKKAEISKASFVVRAHELSTTETYVAVADAVKKAKGGQVSLIAF